MDTKGNVWQLQRCNTFIFIFTKLLDACRTMPKSSSGYNGNKMNNLPGPTSKPYHNYFFNCFDHIKLYF